MIVHHALERLVCLRNYKGNKIVIGVTGGHAWLSYKVCVSCFSWSLGKPWDPIWHNLAGQPEEPTLEGW